MNNIRLKVKIVVSVWSGTDLGHYENKPVNVKMHRKPDATISVNLGRHSQIQSGKERQFVSNHIQSLFNDSIEVIPALIDKELSQKHKL